MYVTFGDNQKLRGKSYRGIDIRNRRISLILFYSIIYITKDVQKTKLITQF